MTETVEVKAETPLIESATAVQAVNISGDFQRSQPISTTRHWSDVLALTPGIATQSQNANVSAYTLRGSDFSSHVIQIDGADMASAQQNATSYVHFPTEAIEDVQVKTGAMDASAPLGVGGVMNIGVKSGTNAFRGAANLSFQKKSWSSNNNPGGTSGAQDSVLPETAIGGPIARDHAWFFGSYLYQDIKNGLARSSATIALPKALEPGFEPFDSKTSGHFLVLKASARLSDHHQAEVFYQRDPQVSDSTLDLYAGPFVNQTQGGNAAFSARSSSMWGSAFSTRFGSSYNNKALQIRTLKGAPSRPIHASTFLSGGTILGTGQVAVLDNGNAGGGYEQPYTRQPSRGTRPTIGPACSVHTNSKRGSTSNSTTRRPMRGTPTTDSAWRRACSATQRIRPPAGYHFIG
jgi:hypothetical protein